MKSLLVISVILFYSSSLFGKSLKNNFEQPPLNLFNALIDTNNNFSVEDIIDSMYFTNEFRVITKKYGNDTVFYTLPLTIIIKDTIKSEIDLKIDDEYITAKKVDCHLFTHSIKLKQNNQHNDTITEQIIIAIFSNTDLKSYDVAYRVTASVDKINATCLISILKPEDPHRINLENPFNFVVNLGTNFDFSNGIQANSLYAKISVFNPNLLWEKVGFTAGIYQNSFLSNDSTKVGHDIEFLNFTNDTISFVDNTVNYKSRSKVDNLALYFGIPVSLRPKDKQFNIYWSPEFEIIKTNSAISREYNNLKSDTILNKPWAYLSGYISSLDLVKIEQKEIVNQYYIKHIGIANFILTFLDNRNNALFLSTTIWGLGKIDGKFKSYYQFKFDISELKYGITLGGEFNGFYSEEPYIGIHLSKIFKLSRLIEYKE
jgi:hypothetical protein